MGETTVKSSDLKRLVDFLNADVSEWDRNANRDSWEDFDKRLLHTFFFYMTGPRDTSETLAAVQRDISRDILTVLDPDIPPEKAVEQVIDRIEEAKLTGFRRVIEASKLEQTQLPYTVVDVLRVRPPAGEKKGRQKPMVNTVAIREGNYDDSARQSFYRLLDGAIRSNSLSGIRNCIHCKKFFLQTGGRLTYCSNSCESAWNRKRRTAAGYFKEKMKKIRQNRAKEENRRQRQGRQQQRLAV